MLAYIYHTWILWGIIPFPWYIWYSNPSDINLDLFILGAAHATGSQAGWPPGEVPRKARKTGIARKASETLMVTASSLLWVTDNLYRMMMDDVGMSQIWDAGPPQQNAPKNLRWESFTFRQRNRSGYGAKQFPPKTKCLILKINVVNPRVNHPQVITTNGIEPIPQS